MNTRALLSTLALMLATSASAVTTPDDTFVGMEPSRTMVTTPTSQAWWSQADSWQAFTEGVGDGWAARFDPATGTPHRMWGAGIDLGDVSSEDAVAQSVLQFVEDHRTLFGVETADIALKSVNYSRSMDAWYVDVDVVREDLRIWRGGLTFRIKQGKLVMMGADSYPQTPITNAPVINRAQAIRSALQQGPAGFVPHNDVETDQWLLPIEDGAKVELRAVWEVRSKTEAPLGHWVAFVDAETSELINVHNEIRFLDGNARVVIDNRIGAGGTIVSDLRFATVSNGSSSTTTNTTGDFTIGNASSYTLTLDGPRVRMFDQAGGESATFTNANPLFEAGDFNQAPRTTWAYVHQVQDWARANAPGVPINIQKINTYVNIPGACNAYYDGNINFLQAGSGCRNTGRLADVIFHEWGHGFHGSSLLSGFWDGSLGEGASDFLSLLMTNDPRVAPSFFVNGGPLRNLDNNNRYPGDYVNNDAYVHTNGLIFGGAMYDTLLALRADFGEPYATDTITDIFVGLLKGGPVVADSFDEARFADDDDNNLANGTPHLCQLLEGFGAHGLGTGVTASASVDHTPIIVARADSPIPVSASVGASSCSSGNGGSGTLNYRPVGGNWTQVSMSRTGSDYSVDMPAFPEGTILEYYISITPSGGSTVHAPLGGEIKPTTMYVGRAIRVDCDTFERNDGGYTHQLVAGTADAGADDWLRGTPMGQAGDPSVPFSGDNVWGNDLGETGWNGEYQNDKHTRLTSAVYDLGHYEGAMLAYRRWLTIEDGFYDRASVRVDGNIVWSNWATNQSQGEDHHIDVEWATHILDVSAYASDGAIQISWDLESDGGLTFGGWNIDDVCVFAPPTPNNRLAITDLTASASGNAVNLSWTNPVMNPIRNVRLVRKVGGRPTGHNDGVNLYETGRVSPNSAGSFRDTNVPSGNVHYAVYGFDGSNWLDWTQVGLNTVPAP